MPKEKHYMDTSVMVEVYIEELKSRDYKNACEVYIYNIGNQYETYFSISAFGELIKKILELETDFNKKMIIMQKIYDKFKKKVKFCSHKKEAFNFAQELIGLDRNLEAMDAYHIATALSYKADKFITIEDFNTKIIEYCKKKGLLIKQVQYKKK